MKTKNLSTAELLDLYDQELLNILKEDLRAFKAKTQFLRIIKQVRVRTSTAA
jgi:hypothetical protein